MAAEDSPPPERAKRERSTSVHRWGTRAQAALLWQAEHRLLKVTYGRRVASCYACLLVEGVLVRCAPTAG